MKRAKFIKNLQLSCAYTISLLIPTNREQRYIKSTVAADKKLRQSIISQTVNLPESLQTLASEHMIFK